MNFPLSSELPGKEAGETTMRCGKCKMTKRRRALLLSSRITDSFLTSFRNTNAKNVVKPTSTSNCEHEDMTTSTSGYDLPNTPIAPNTPNTPNNHSSPKTPKTPTILEEEKRKVRPGSKFQHALRNHGMAEPSTALLHHVGQKFQDVFQIKQGCYADIPPAKISEMMKSNSLDNAPTQSLLSVVNGILDESVERKDGEIPYRVACLLRKVVQEIERRISTQAEHLKTQNNLFKAREEKYKSRISVLEAISTGSSEETQMVKNQLQQMKSEKSTIEKKKAEEQDVERLIKQMDNNHHEIVSLKEELEIAKKNYEQLHLQMDTESKGSHEIESLKEELAIAKKNYEQLRLQTEAKGAHEIVTLKEELEMTKKNNEQLCLKLEEEAKGAKDVVSLKEELEIAKKNNEHLQMEKEAKGAHEIVSLKEELEIAKKNNEELQLKLETEAKGAHENVSLKEELEIAKKNYEQLRVKVETEANHDISSLKQELEIARKNYDQRCSQMEKEAKGTQLELEERLKEVMNQLTDSRNKFKKLEVSFESKSQRWNKKEHVYQIFTESQLAALQELKFSSQTIRQEITQTQKIYVEDSSRLGRQIAVLGKAAESYYEVLAENRKLHNEVQDLKGNIRVYCRIRPFLPKQKGKETMVESVGDSGELIVVNPAKQGKEARRSFKFNKVYGPAATQVHVYSDIRPLVRSVLDGYNVCIFAYGQTGSGKTYTMSGPDGASEEDWGVNYRALNDLFSISQTRQSTYTYEIGVQMIEIYNEQVRDLLSSGGSQKKLGIMSTSQASRLAVPDASMVPVQATSDVLDLMEIGLKNRAKGSTAINERSSRSHSVVTIHSRGTDLKTGSLLHGSLHLVDLAGSERVDRSEVTGDRLKEAQHINKSLSALGDVIFALSQKSSHVPYRNSKLTQVLQSSLGGQAKTLMFVQLNPDTSSFSESLSTLKFAERVSGVELGAAKSSKEGRDVRELMEQVVSLKDTITKKDAEIERLQGVNG